MKKIENQIREQLENREIPVSEDAWDKLSGMMQIGSRSLSGAETTKKLQLKKWWLYAAAASVVILISVFIINPFEKVEMREIQIVDSEKTIRQNSIEEHEMIQDEVPAEIATIVIEPEPIRPESQKNTKVEPEFNSEKIEKIINQSQTEIVRKPVEKTEGSPSPEIKLNLPEIKTPQQIASNEVQEIKPEPEKKKSKYVDAGMLLYSVENNQAISETSDNTKLVIIDFNK